MTIIEQLAHELDRPVEHIENVVRLLDEGNTIPFIARYRKELHGSMDDTALRTDVLDIKDLKPGMVLTGTVRNVIDFGVFVDIGVHQDGLVHISQVCNKFIKHPSEAVAVGDVVKVVVLDVDEKKHRISLSMKQVPEE